MSKSSLMALLLCVLGMLCGIMGTAAATDFSNVGLGITETGAMVNAIIPGPTTGQLYVGGSFTQVNGTGTGAITANNIALWDGAAWNALAEGLDGQVNAIAVIGRFVYVGGAFQNTLGPNPIPVNHLAVWNSLANQWFAVNKASGPTGGGVNGTVYSLNAANAQYPDPANPGSFLTTTQLIVGGSFMQVAGSSNGFNTGYGNLAIYNPAVDPLTFTAFQGGVDATVTCGSVLGTNDLVNGGSFTMAGGIIQNGVATSDVGNFVPTITFGHPVGAIAYDSAGNIYVGGSFTLTQSYFTPTPVTNPPTTPVTVTGNSYGMGVLLNGTNSWGGLSGGVSHTIPTASPGTVDAIFFSDLNTSEPIVGGSFDQAGTAGQGAGVVGAANLVQWNPSATAWEPYIGGTDGPVLAIGQDSYHSIYVGGSFVTATSNITTITSAIVRVGPNQDTGITGTASASATATSSTTATGASASSSATGTGTTSTATAGSTGAVAVPSSSGSSGCGLGSSMGVMLILAMLLAWKRLR